MSILCSLPDHLFNCFPHNFLYHCCTAYLAYLSTGGEGVDGCVKPAGNRCWLTAFRGGGKGADLDEGEESAVHPLQREKKLSGVLRVKKIEAEAHLKDLGPL